MSQFRFYEQLNSEKENSLREVCQVEQFFKLEETEIEESKHPN